MRRPGRAERATGALKDGKKGREEQEGVKVEKTLKKRRVDDFHTALSVSSAPGLSTTEITDGAARSDVASGADLVTDRVKLGWFSILVIVLFPLVLYELLVVSRLAACPITCSMKFLRGWSFWTHPKTWCLA